MRSSRSSIPLILALAAAVLMAARPAPGADPRLEAAKREGKVTWYTSVALTTAERIAKLFESAFGVPVAVNRTGSQRVLQRVLQEAQAGIKVVDVIQTSDAGHFVLLKSKGLLARYIPAGTEGFPAAFKDRDGSYLGWRATLSVIAYNPKLVPAAEAPRSWKDLLQPKWKGKLVKAHPGYSGIIATGMLALVKEFSWDYFRQLAKNGPMIVQSANDPAQVVASGERPVAADGAEYFLYSQRKKGNPLAIVYPAEGVPLVISPTAIARDAPHPAAARLFTDFIFTKAVQQLMADREGLYVPHPEVTYPADKPKLKDLKLLQVDAEELESRNQELKRTFAEIFGV
ncbi:MAG: extracellular solute-binding protein [Deltaproteobacteria bacterium]|nr:extracellular solute-binding protein [Deltaproteobacteria bacterium]